MYAEKYAECEYRIHQASQQANPTRDQPNQRESETEKDNDKESSYTNIICTYQFISTILAKIYSRMANKQRLNFKNQKKENK